MSLFFIFFNLGAYSNTIQEPKRGEPFFETEFKSL